MKFSCDKNILLEAIATASRAVSSKSSLPLLEGILIKAEEGLTLTGYNLSFGIRTKIDADVISEGQIILGARILGEIIRKLPEDIVYFEVNDKLLTTIKCGHAVFNLIGSSAEEFPQMPTVSQDQNISLPQNTLKSVISQTIFAVSDNESKPIHTGCLFETEEETLNVVAVDGYRMAVRREKLENPIQDALKFVVPGYALREIERILQDNDTAVEIYPDEKHILFSIDETVLITRLIEGEFLNYRAAIPEEMDHEITADKRAFITSVERVSLIVSEKLKNPVRLTFEENTLKLSCITAIGKSYDECAFNGAIENLEIGFNNRYLLDALRACPDESVKISLKGALNPMIITPVEGNQFTYLVLPVRLKAND